MLAQLLYVAPTVRGELSRTPAYTLGHALALDRHSNVIGNGVVPLWFVTPSYPAQTAREICCEPFERVPQLGRLTLRDEGKTIAIGKVTKVASMKKVGAAGGGSA